MSEPRQPIIVAHRGLHHVHPENSLAAFRAAWDAGIAWCECDVQLSRGALAGMFALGVLGWTLLEYLLHRWVFHFKPDQNVEWQRDASWLIHGIHHDYPYDPDRLVMPEFADNLRTKLRDPILLCKEPGL